MPGSVWARSELGDNLVEMLWSVDPMMTSLIVGACALCWAGTNEDAVEISANRWFNPITIRVPEDRTFVLLFFSTVEGKDETRRYVTRLRKLRLKSDTTVMGLSAESPERVERFVKKHGIRFPVGAESRAYKRFRVKKFPTLVVVDFADRASATHGMTWSLDQLDDYVERSADDSAFISEELNETSSTSRLEDHARHDPENTRRSKALHLLRGRMDAAGFLKLCDELLASTNSSLLRGEIAYQRQLADPAVSDKEPRLAPSVLAGRSRRENPDAPRWERLRNYEVSISDLSTEQLVADFFDYQTDAMDPENLLIRRDIASRLNAISEDGSIDEKLDVRAKVMSMLPGEPDAAVRLWLVGALWATTAPGDLEVADFLAEQLKTEPNVRSVRPMMETVIRCMRTGEGPCGNDE